MSLKNLKIFFLSIISVYTCSVAKAITEPVNSDSLFSKTQIAVNFEGNLSHFIVSKQYGVNAPRSIASPGFDANINLTFNVNKTVGVQIGLGGGFQNFNYIINKDYAPNGTVSGYYGTATEIGYFSIPINLAARKQIGENIFLYGNAGVDIRFYDSFDGVSLYSSGDSNTKSFVKYDEVTNSGPMTLMIPKIGLGVLLQLPYNDLLSFGLNANFGQYSAYNSTYYYFDYQGKTTGRGTYVADASFIGINIGYVFTRVRSH